MEELLKLLQEAPELAAAPQVVHPDAWEDLPSGRGYIVRGEVFEDLAKRVRNGQVKAQGQRHCSDDDESDPIPPSRWDTLIFQSMPDGLCGALSKKTLWVRVQFRQCDVTAWWPPRGKPAPRSSEETFSFGEIADEVVRLNPGTTRDDILARLDKSFGEGEFERENESTVLFEGPEGQWWPRDREFLSAARQIPGYERLHRVAFRLPKRVLRAWSQRWAYHLPQGFIEIARTNPIVPVDDHPGGEPPGPKPGARVPLKSIVPTLAAELLHSGTIPMGRGRRTALIRAIQMQLRTQGKSYGESGIGKALGEAIGLWERDNPGK